MIAAPQQLPNGGLRLPPFPSRDHNPNNPNPPPPKVDLDEKAAEEMKISIHTQLDDFDAYALPSPHMCLVSDYTSKTARRSLSSAYANFACDHGNTTSILANTCGRWRSAC